MSEQEQYKEWKAMPLSERMRSEIAMASAYANDVADLEAKLEAMGRLRNAVSRDGTLVPYHLRTWADRISETSGYSGANIEVWLRDVAAALAAAQQEKEDE